MYKLFLGLLFTFILPDPPVKAPVITGNYCGTVTTVTGTCNEKDGTTIEVFKNGAGTGTVTLTSKSWSITGVSYSPGDKINAQATNDQGQSPMSDTITVSAAGVTADAGTDQTLCNTTTATLGGNNPSPGTGLWTVISGGATVTDPANPASGVSALAAGVNTFRWTITNAPCSPSTDDVSIIVKAPLTADAGPDQNLCNTTMAVLAGNNPSPGTGMWTVVAGGGTVDDPANRNSTVSKLGTGANTFRWTVTNSPCASSSDDVTINVSALPSTSNAGADQTLCNVTTSKLDGNVPLVGSGKWTVVTGGATVDTPTDAKSTVSNLAVGTNTFRWSIWTLLNPLCTSTDDITIIVKAPVPVADAGPDQNVCNTTTATVSGNSPSPGTGMWTVIAGGASVTDPANAVSGVINLAPGANTFRWTISNPPCAGSIDDVTINVQSATVADAGPDQSLCSVTAATLAGNTPSTGTGAWTKVSGSGTITTAADPASGITGLTTGKSVFRWTITNGACVSTDDITITISAPATAADAGPDQNLCNATVATLAGNTASAGTSTWTKVSGNGTITTPGSPGSGLTGLTVGTAVFRWTIKNGACVSTDDVSITVNASATAADAGPNQTLCNVTTASLAGNAPVTGTGGWTNVSGSGTITNPASSTSGVTGLTTGSAVFKWTITNGACVSTDNVTIAVSAPVANVNAGPDQTLCSATATLSGNTPAAGTGTWTRASGSGTVDDPANPASGVSGLAPGISVFRWTIKNGACSDFDEMTIDNGNTALTVNAGPDQTLCNTGTATLAGNTPASGSTGTWSVITGGATVTSPSSANSGVSNLAAGINTFRWTIKDAACVASDDITIIISAPPTAANAGPDQLVCTTNATLAGNTPAIGKGTWTVIAGGGTVTAPANPTSAVTNLAQGVNTFRWTISNAPCTASTDDVTITVNGNLTAANAGTDQTLCNASTVTLAGNTPATGTAGTWTKFSGSGSITTPSSPASGVTGLTPGVSVFVWTISNPPCTPSSDTVKIINSAPGTVPDAGQNQTLCNTTSTVLAGNTPATGTGTWTKVSGSGTIVTPGNPGSGVTGLAAGASVFRWTIAYGACTASDDVTVVVDALTAANAGTDQTLCNVTTATLAGNTPATGSGTWTKLSGSGTITSPSNPASGVTGLSAGPSVFRWTITKGACTSKDDVTIIISSPPTAANAGPNQTLCSSNAVLAGNTPATGTGMWTKISGSGNITAPANPASAVTGLSAGTSVFKWTISNGACSLSDTVSIINGNVPVVNAGPDQSLCNSSGTILAGNTPPAGITGVWSVVLGGATVASASNPNSAVTNLSAGTNIFLWTIKDGGCVAMDSITINVNTTPTTANAGPDQTSLLSTATLAGNTPVTGKGLWTVITGSATVTSPANPKSGVTGLSLGLNTFRWTISAPPCPNSFDEVNIQVALTNIPPDAKNDTVLLFEDSFLSIQVQANDYDANFDSLVTSIITPPANGKVVLNGKKIDYYPDKNFNGKDKIVYSVCDGGTPALCDTAVVVITVTPVNDPLTMSDSLLTAHQNTSATICIPISDVDGAQAFTASSCKNPAHGTFSSAITGTQLCVTYVPGPDYMGPDSLCLVVCDNGIPSFCDTTHVFIKVIEKSDVVFNIPQAFSPNADGVNDLFVIPGIEEYPDNHIVIFNPWGNRVFEQQPYTNQWDGSSQKGGFFGNQLPDGTYYYVLDLGNGSDPVKAYVYVSR